ncbi:MAG TPA: chromosomal replication initiator protein DnaA [Rhizomicrobium sp.]|nr:chromosomal replication initiator protein DnaA [Rhizomicrobium sp.]
MAQSMANASQPDWNNVWLAARERIRKEIGDATFDAWIRPLTLTRSQGSDLHIAAPSAFARNWVANHHTARIERALNTESGATVTLSLEVAQVKPVLASVTPREVAPVISEVQPTSEPRRALSTKVLQPAQTFDSFVPGPATEFAWRAARSVGTGENDDISLLYVHGGFGYGKSHLLNAIALEARKRGKRALFLGAEDFMRQFLGALSRKETLGFKEELRAADMLLIDDLQHLCRSTYTVSEFLHTLNAFSDLRRKLVIAADKAPGAIDNLSADVRSRLSGGLVIALDKPDRMTRLAILKARATEFARGRASTPLPDDVLERIADMEENSPRDLIGVFTKLATYADLTKQPLTLEAATQILGQTNVAPRKTSIEDIQRKTAEFYKLELRDFQSPQRSRRVARPRQVAMYLARELTMRSLPEIGKRFGGRDHTTVLHACRRIAALCNDDPMFKQEVDFLRQVLSRAVN